MDIVNFDALKAQGKIIDAKDVDPNEDYFILGKKNVHYTTNSMKATNYPVWAIKAGDILNPLPTYKVYTALVDQSGTSAPILTVLENTLGVSLTPAYDSLGTYFLVDSTNGFTANKTIVYGSNNYVEATMGGTFFPVNLITSVLGTDTISLETISSDTHLKVNGSLTAFIEIRVYN